MSTRRAGWFIVIAYSQQQDQGVYRSFDGGSNWNNLLPLDDSTVEGGTSSLARADAHEVLPLSNPADASAMIRFGITDGGNDWWWAIDNVSVSVVPEPTTGIMGWLAASFGLLFGRKKRS